MNWYKKAQTENKALYFLRYTSDPLGDLERGWSCNVHRWAKNRDGVKKYYRYFEPDVSEKDFNVKYDKRNDIWCIHPEMGLSSFAFWNSESLERAKDYISGFQGFGGGGGPDNMGVFLSSNYYLEKGSDKEDLFTEGTFVGFISENTNWDDFMNSLNKKELRQAIPVERQKDIKNNLEMFVENDIDMFEKWDREKNELV